MTLESDCFTDRNLVIRTYEQCPTVNQDGKQRTGCASAIRARSLGSILATCATIEAWGSPMRGVDCCFQAASAEAGFWSGEFPSYGWLYAHARGFQHE